jgi:hypothetical protein
LCLQRRQPRIRSLLAFVGSDRRLPRLAGRCATIGCARLSIPCAVRRALITGLDREVCPGPLSNSRVGRPVRSVRGWGAGTHPRQLRTEAGLRAIVRAVPAPVGVTLGPDGIRWRERAGGIRIPAPLALAISIPASGDVWQAASTRASAEGRDVPAQASFPIPGRRTGVPELQGRLARRAVTKT